MSIGSEVAFGQLSPLEPSSAELKATQIAKAALDAAEAQSGSTVGANRREVVAQIAAALLGGLFHRRRQDTH